MAADQLNKRSKVSNVVGHTWEHQKAKRKKLSCYDLNMRSSISLEWDEMKKTVVPKKEQICIAHRELIPFLPVVQHHQNVLGDVFSAPPELFDLDNLTDVLSYEVWQTHISEQEREFLTQLLPGGANPHKIVHELLTGNNLFFGNPFLKWGASLCSGDCHPDAVLRQEQCNKANKKAYYTELQAYHTRMIGSLQLWKERWSSCKNSGNDFMRKILRARKDFDKSCSSHATSDSCSWDADDKAYRSDSPNLIMMHGEASKRVFRSDFENKYYDSSDGWKSVARPTKGEKLQRRNIECGDGARYMSYIKVSKEQHQQLKKSMKHPNTSIQHRSLNHVLGDLDTFCVQPYEVFEEEERQRLHEHWLHLARKDLPAGFDNWRKWQSAKRQLTNSLRRELNEKLKSDLDICNQYVVGNEKSRLDNGETHHQPLIDPEDIEQQNANSIFQFEADDEITTQTKHRQESAQIGLSRMAKSDAFGCNLGRADGGYPSEIWPAVGLPSVSYPKPMSYGHGYASIGELSLDLQRDPHTGFLHRQSDALFNQDRNELLLHSLFKDPGRSSFHLAGSNVMLETGHFGRSSELRHKRLGDVYTLHQENMHAGGVGGHVPDWLELNGGGEVLSQNWFGGDEGLGLGGMGNGSHMSAADENLFSVVSPCSMVGGNYGGATANGVVVAAAARYMGGGGYESEGGGGGGGLQDCVGKPWNHLG